MEKSSGSCKFCGCAPQIANAAKHTPQEHLDKGGQGLRCYGELLSFTAQHRQHDRPVAKPQSLTCSKVDVQDVPYVPA